MIAVIVIPILLLIFAEIGLRVIDFGYCSHAIIKCEFNGKKAYCDNPKFTRLFFPVNLIRRFCPFVFYADKPLNTYRIFVLGSSAAMGAPEPTYNFGRILEAMLNNKYPQTNFEVINVATTAINSHVILPIAKDCARHQPDLFVLYAGNNEVVGPYSIGTIFAPISPSLSAIRASIAIKSTRTGQLLDTLLGSIATDKTIPQSWEGMEMFLKKQVRLDDPALKYVYNHFEQNLKDICQTSLKAGAKVILCNVGSNLKDCPPFASLHKQNLSDAEKRNWDAVYEQGVTHEKTANYAEAIKCYLDAAKIDDTYADLQFRLGRCYWAIEQYDQARDRYVQARQLDTLRFRSDTRINALIQHVAESKAKEGVYFTDAIAAFDRNSPHGTPGKELFYEHVHLGFKGNYILARTVFEQVENILPERIKNNSNRPVMSEQDCAERLAYTGWDQYMIAGKVLSEFIRHPPFTNQLYHDTQVREFEKQLEELRDYTSPAGLKAVAEQYEKTIKQYPSDSQLTWKYVQLLDIGLKNPSAVAAQCRNILKHFPSYQVKLGLARALQQQGKLDEAAGTYQECVKMSPSYTVYSGLANVLYTKKDFKGAAKCFSKLLEYDSTKSSFNIYIYTCYARALYESGNHAKAKKVLMNAISIFPKDQTGYFYHSLGIMQEREGKIDEAISSLRAATETLSDPNNKDYLMFKEELDRLTKK
jgi:tetratricopeptide (TPR) repeat protein